MPGMRKPPNTTVRSELQTIGRTMSPARGAEANAQRRQTRMPWIWLAVGLVVVAIFTSWMMIGKTPASRGAPRHSAIFSTPVVR